MERSRWHTGDAALSLHPGLGGPSDLPALVCLRGNPDVGVVVLTAGGCCQAATCSRRRGGGSGAALAMMAAMASIAAMAVIFRAAISHPRSRRDVFSAMNCAAADRIARVLTVWRFDSLIPESLVWFSRPGMRRASPRCGTECSWPVGRLIALADWFAPQYSPAAPVYGPMVRRCSASTWPNT